MDYKSFPVKDKLELIKLFGKCYNYWLNRRLRAVKTENIKPLPLPASAGRKTAATFRPRVTAARLTIPSAAPPLCGGGHAYRQAGILPDLNLHTMADWKTAPHKAPAHVRPKSGGGRFRPPPRCSISRLANNKAPGKPLSPDRHYAVFRLRLASSPNPPTASSVKVAGSGTAVVRLKPHQIPLP